MNAQKLTVFLAVALFLSLAANFFFAGRMLGGAVAPGEHRLPPERHAGGLRDMHRAEWQKREETLHEILGERDRAVMRETREAYDGLFDALRTQLESARAKVAAAMEAEPLDQEVLDDAIAAEAAIKSRLLQEMTAVREETLERLSPEGRAALRQMMVLRRGAARPPSEARRKGQYAPAPPYEEEGMKLLPPERP